MANNTYTVTSLEALKYICSVINKTVDLPSTVISDTSIATNTTYSSFKLDKEFTTLEDELKHYTDTAIAGLNKLTKEIINDKALVVKDNVLYLYKAADNPSNDYMQMMLINGVAVELGSTQVDMSDYYSRTDSDNKFADKLDLTTLTTSFNDLKTVHDTHVADSVAHLTQDERDKILTTDDIATSISTNPSNDKVASEKAVNDKIDTVSNRIQPNAVMFRKENTSYSTLSELIQNHEFFKSSSTEEFIFSAEGFDDLPVTNWGFSIRLYTKPGNNYVVACKMLSNIFYTRYMSYDGTWDGGWQKVCTTSVVDVPKTEITFSNTSIYAPAAALYNYYEVKDGVCYVSLYVNCNNASTGPLTVINESLPIPKRKEYKTLSAWNNATDNIRCVVEENGRLSLRLGTSGGQYIETFSYRVKES